MLFEVINFYLLYFCLADLPSLFSLHTKKQPHIQTGIPEEAFDLECPDHDLKTQVLQEFILIDDKYTEKVVELEDTHTEALGYVDMWNVRQMAKNKLDRLQKSRSVCRVFKMCKIIVFCSLITDMVKLNHDHTWAIILNRKISARYSNK